MAGAPKTRVKRKTGVKMNKKPRPAEVEYEEDIEDEIEEEEEEAPRRTSKRKATGKATARAGKRTGRKSTRGSKVKEKKSKGPLIVGILGFLILGGGIGGGVWYIKTRPDPTYIVHQPEAKALKQIQDNSADIFLSDAELARVARDSEDFLTEYSKPQVYDEETSFTSPNLTVVKEYRSDAIEGTALYKRYRMRTAHYEKIEKDRADLALKVSIEEEDRKRREEEERKRKEIEAKKAAEEAAITARGEELDERRQEVRTTLLDSTMISKSMFDPLNTEEAYDFVEADKLFDDWIVYPREKQQRWGNTMKDLAKRAHKTYRIVADTQDKYQGREMLYEGRKGTIISISLSAVKMSVVENVIAGVEKRSILIRPIHEIPSKEFWELVKEGSKRGEDDTDLHYDFACLMYMFKRFPAARMHLTKCGDKQVDILLAEIDAFSPDYNRRECARGLEEARKLFDDGRRRDSLKILAKMAYRFKQTKEWSEVEGEYNDLKSESEKLKED